MAVNRIQGNQNIFANPSVSAIPQSGGPRTFTPVQEVPPVQGNPNRPESRSPEKGNNLYLLG